MTGQLFIQIWGVQNHVYGRYVIVTLVLLICVGFNKVSLFDN